MAVKKAPQLAKTAKQKKDYLNIFLVFFASYFIYLLTIYPTVGPEDSGEILTSAATLDIVHPPGYPLHTLLGFLFSKLIFFGNIGWRVNLMSAFFAAATVTLLYLFLKRLTKTQLIALGGSLLFAFSDIFWSQAIRTEVYTLCIFFLVLISYLLLIWDEKQDDKYLYWTAFLYGLSWTNAYTIMALIGPPMVIYVLIRNWRVILKIKLILGCLALFFLGLSVYAYMPLRTWLGPYDNPAYIKHDGLHTWPQFWKFVNRQIYGGMVEALGTGPVKTGVAGGGPFDWLIAIFNWLVTFGQRIVNASMNGLVFLLKIIIEQLIYLPIIFLVPGIIALWQKTRKFSVYIFLCFFFYTVFQITFVTIAQNMSAFTAHNNRPFYIASILFTAISSPPVFPFSTIRPKKKTNGTWSELSARFRLSPWSPTSITITKAATTSLTISIKASWPAFRPMPILFPSAATTPLSRSTTCKKWINSAPTSAWKSIITPTAPAPTSWQKS